MKGDAPASYSAEETRNSLGRQYPRVSLTDQVQCRAGQGSRLDTAPLVATIASCEVLPRLVHPLISRAKLSQMASSDWPSSLGFSARLSAVTKMQVLRREKRPRKAHLVRACLFVVNLGITLSAIHPMFPIYHLPVCCDVKDCNTDRNPELLHSHIRV
jgi:hypothetical protein